MRQRCGVHIAIGVVQDVLGEMVGEGNERFRGAD